MTLRRVVKTLAVGAILVLVLGASVRTRLVRAILHPSGRYGLPTLAVTADDISQHPEAHLSYPGAVDDGHRPDLGLGGTHASLVARAERLGITTVATSHRCQGLTRPGRSPPSERRARAPAVVR